VAHCALLYENDGVAVVLSIHCWYRICCKSDSMSVYYLSVPGAGILIHGILNTRDAFSYSTVNHVKDTL
jgi:hypothetical protein